MAYDHELTDDEKTELLRIARATLREYARSGHVPPGKPHRKVLCDNAGVFVSLHKGDELRGCIGVTDESMPLYKAIQEMAVAAANRDSRFASVSGDEVDELTIEVSVLGPRERITSADDLIVGKHGVRVAVGDQRGLLLPQVATEHDWDADTFLDKACTKAGLAEGAWRADDATIEVFTAQVFDEISYPAPTFRR